MSVINASEFRKRATRVIEIDGFEPGEKIEVRIKPASILNLLAVGKLPNNLLSVVQDLFTGSSPDEVDVKNVTDDIETVRIVMEMIDIVCEECLVEPTYKEIGDLLTDNQKGQIMTAAQGKVNAVTPSIQK